MNLISTKGILSRLKTILFIFILLFLFFFSFFLVVVFYLLNFLLSFKTFYLIKNSSFERGFERIGKVHNSFRIHFFIIILMFVIFDLEVVMLLGFLISSYYSFYIFFLIFLFVFGGFYIE
jgi:NADH:ubiquinone oxidoreductase subunit 3 (subunit A)